MFWCLLVLFLFSLTFFARDSLKKTSSYISKENLSNGTYESVFDEFEEERNF